MKLLVNNICHSLEHGPGNRLVIWVQGCSLNCRGCFNPETHSHSQGREYEVQEIADIINRETEGITISGGEPLDQAEVLLEILRKVRTDLTVILFSGFSIDEIVADDTKRKCLLHVDLAITGRYDHTLPHPYYGKKLIKVTERIDCQYLRPKMFVEYTIGDTYITKSGIFKYDK